MHQLPKSVPPSRGSADQLPETKGRVEAHSLGPVAPGPEAQVIRAPPEGTPMILSWLANPCSACNRTKTNSKLLGTRYLALSYTRHCGVPRRRQRPANHAVAKGHPRTGCHGSPLPRAALRLLIGPGSLRTRFHFAQRRHDLSHSGPTGSGRLSRFGMGGIGSRATSQVLRADGEM